jgi:hypothetical protein
MTRIKALLAALVVAAGIALAGSPAAAALPVQPNTSCRVTSNYAFTSRGIAHLDGVGNVWAYWQPAAVKPANNCNGVAIRNWNDHNAGNKDTVAWVVIYPNYPSSTGSYQAQGGVGVVHGNLTWTSMGFVPDGMNYRVFAVDQYSGGNPNTPTADRED